MALADELIANLLNAGGLIGNSFAQGRQNAQQEQIGAQQLQLGQIKLNQFQAQQDQQKRYQADLEAYTANPTPQALAGLMSRYPEQADAIKQGYDILEAPARQSRLASLYSLYTASNSGRGDLAAGQIESLIAAEKGRGLDTSEAEQLRDGLKSNDPAVRKRSLDGLRAFAQAHLAIADTKFADQIGLGKQEMPFTPLGDGQVLDRRTGEVSGERRPKWLFNAESGSFVREPDSGGGDLSSSGRAIPFANLIRQESRGRQFGKDGTPLTSSAGAIGIAQVMPGTAPEAARLAGVPFDNVKYRTDADYNALIGEAYYNEQRRRFGRDDYAAAAYNAGPGRVQKAIAMSERSGRDWKTFLPAETRDYVAKVSGGGSPNVVQVLPPKSKAIRMSPQEVAALGLDPNTVYFRGANGIPQAVGGQNKAVTAARAVPEAVVKRVQPSIDARDSLVRSLGAFKDDFAGNALTGDLENQIDSMLNTGTPGQRQWWADFRATDNQIRNDLFGSALTATEKAAYEATTISPRMSGKTIRANLSRRKAIVSAALARQQRFLKLNRYSPEAVDELFAPLGEGGRADPVVIRYVRGADGKLVRAK